MISDRYNNAARAVSMLTVWLDSPDSTESVTEELIATLQEGDEAIVELVCGLVSVAGMILIRHAGAENREQEVLQEIGLKIAEGRG
ncbi:hypothetical protein [Candidatus Poriferisodalis sp.]|uniref:hypothetical protein n=1 Tax=Candidatus Poriferisodalis sp. TaxID=3101277 RepID=UPI003B02412C